MKSKEDHFEEKLMKKKAPQKSVTSQKQSMPVSKSKHATSTLSKPQEKSFPTKRVTKQVAVKQLVSRFDESDDDYTKVDSMIRNLRNQSFCQIKEEGSSNSLRSEEDGLHHQPTLSIQKMQDVSLKNCDSRFGMLVDSLKKQNIQVIPGDQIQNSGEVIGKGGFGMVFRGSWRNNDVAIKEMVISYEEFKIMQAELEFLAKCRFPTMILFFGIYMREITKDQLIQCSLVMELMKQDLETYIFKDTTKRTQKDLIRIAYQIAQSIAYLHSNQIVHRDIKPKNVLLDTKQDAKLTDLGIARVLENKQQTQGMTLAYTAKYASPETTIEEVTSFASDIWSFGLLLYELFTGKSVWAHIPKQSKIIVALINKESPFESGWESSISNTTIQELIKKAVEYDSKKRPNAQELEQILSKL